MKSLSGTPARMHTAFRFAILPSHTWGGCQGGNDAVAPRTTDVAADLKPVFTAGVGSTSALLGRATFIDPSDPVLKVKRTTGDWQQQSKNPR